MENLLVTGKQAKDRVRSAIPLIPMPNLMRMGELEVPLAFIDPPYRAIVLRPNLEGQFVWWALSDLRAFVFVECSMTLPTSIKFDLMISTEVNPHILNGILRTGLLGITPNKSGDMSRGVYYEFPITQQVIDLVAALRTKR